MKRIVRATAVGLALGATVTLSACGQMRTAATVDGRTITEDQVNTVVKEINAAFKLQSPFTADNALTVLIAAPEINDIAAREGLSVTPSVVRASPDLANLSDSSVEVVRATDLAQKLSQAGQVELSQRMQKLKVTVNPKYGTYNPEGPVIVGPSQPDWLTTPKDGATASPVPAAG